MDKIQKVHDWFNRIGKFTLVFGYFIPGVRYFTGFAAGMSRLELPIFAGYAYTGAFCWSITFLSIGFILGKEWYKIHSYLHFTAIFSIILLVVRSSHLLCSDTPENNAQITFQATNVLM